MAIVEKRDKNQKICDSFHFKREIHKFCKLVLGNHLKNFEIN